jgi:TonB-linked SusC/RagA family outer membrane protein
MKKLNHLTRTVFTQDCSGITFRFMKVMIILLFLIALNVPGIGSNPDSDKKSDLTALIQQARVTGRVTDEQGNPMPGVNVQIEGTTVGVLTDANGNYQIDKPRDNVVLVFSFIGYTTQRMSAAGRTAINVNLVSEVQALEEVVVTGYSAQRRKDIAGSIAVVQVENLRTVASRSVQQALQGMASGVDITQSGVPGAAPKIYIRGVTSFGNTDPLVIVDGIEQSLNNISSVDIESIQVLKDAGAASIYGVRGSNGVILVTTKKGKAGAPVISYEGSYGIQFPDYVKVYQIAFPGNPRFLNGIPDYMYRGPAGAGVAMAGDPAVDPAKYFWQSPNRGQNYIIQKVDKEGFDWYHALFKRAPTTEHNITASGGTDKSKYLFSLGYLQQQGTLVKTNLQRYSVRVNTEYTIGKNIRVGENANIIHRNNAGFSENSQFGGIVETMKQQPIVPLKDIGGNWGGTFGGPELGDGQNPVGVQYYNNENDVPLDWYVIGNGFAEVDFLKGFTARTSMGFNINNSFNSNFNTTQVENVQANTSPNSLSVTSGYGSTMTFTNTLKYKKTFAKHNLEAMVGSEAIQYVSRSVNGYRETFFSEDPSYLVLAGGTAATSNSSSIYEESLFSIFSNKYYLGATLRRDGSSRFGPESRYGIFPSFSLAWRISDEGFMQNISWLDDLKIRGSYGVLGSQNNVSASNAFNLYGTSVTGSYYDIAGSGTSEVQGFYVSRIGNPRTSWEENIITNVGFDATVLNNSLDISLEWYKKSIKGLLFSEPLPATVLSGATAPTVNIGDIQNIGIDATVAYRGKIGSDFKYSVRANVTHYKNECVDIPSPGYFGSGSWQGVGTPVRNQEGHPISSFFGYNIIGLFNSAEEVTSSPTQSGAAPGRFKYEDINDDKIINADDRKHLGDPNPSLTAGLNLGANYKGFDLSAFFYASLGNEICNLTRSYLYFMSFYPTTNKSNELLNAWTPENTNTTIPKIETAGTESSSGAMNSFYIEDGSYLKLKSLQLGYTFGPDILQAIRLSKLRLYVQAANLFTLTKYTGLDPEFIGGGASVHGVDLGSYPNNELNIYFGVSVTF